MKLIILFALTATVLCTANSGKMQAGSRDAQTSPGDIPDSMVLAESPFNDTETVGLDARDGDINKRAYHNVYFCVDPNWGGYCANRGGPAGACSKLTSIMCHFYRWLRALVKS